jgi:hypothetical protein
MMEIVMIGPSPERQPVPKGPREIVPRMRIYSLEQPERDPYVDSEDVEVLSEETV